MHQSEEELQKLENNYRGRLEKKMLKAMIRSLEKVKGKMRSGEVQKPRHKKLKFSGKPQESHNWSINSTNQNVPHGHSVCGAATMHLIWSEIPRAYRHFTFCDRHDDHRIREQLMGLTNPTYLGELI